MALYSLTYIHVFLLEAAIELALYSQPAYTCEAALTASCAHWLDSYSPYAKCYRSATCAHWLDYEQSFCQVFWECNVRPLAVTPHRRVAANVLRFLETGPDEWSPARASACWSHVICGRPQSAAGCASLHTNVHINQQTICWCCIPPRRRTGVPCARERSARILI